MQAEKIRPAEELRIKGRKDETPVMPPNEDAMELLRTSGGLRPPQKPQFARDFARENPYVSLPEDAPVGEPGGLQLLRTMEFSQEPDTERSTTPSGSPPSPPSPRLRQLEDDVVKPDPDIEPLYLSSPQLRDDMDVDDDIPVWDPEGEAESQSAHATPTDSPPARNDMDLIMDLDDDIAVWDPEDDDGGPLTRQAPRSSSSEGLNAYQDHLRGFLREHSLQKSDQQETPGSLPASIPKPAPRPVPVQLKPQAAGRYLEHWTKMKQAKIVRSGDRPLHPDATGLRAWKDGRAVGLDPPEAQKEESSDKELLEALFMSVARLQQ